MIILNLRRILLKICIGTLRGAFLMEKICAVYLSGRMQAVSLYALVRFRVLRLNYSETRGGDVSETQNYILAEQDYMSGMKYKDIAEKYGVTINTVKSWKVRYKWNKKGVHTKSEKVCTQKKCNKKVEKDVFVDEVDQVIKNKDLTDKQRLFCIYYIRNFNATKAYQKAYKCSYETAMVEGSKTLRNPKVKEEILQLKMNRLNREYFAEDDVFQKYMDIAFSDITDYVSFGTEEVPVMAMYGPVQVKDEETGEKKTLTKIVNTVRFNESTNIDGTLISEVKQGRDGTSIKLLDKMKALQWISDHMDLATEEQKARIAQIRANTERIKKNSNDDDGEDGVVIVNDAQECCEDIGHCDTEISSDIQQQDD